MCVKLIASQRWDVFLRHGVVTTTDNINYKRTLKLTRFSISG